MAYANHQALKCLKAAKRGREIKNKRIKKNDIITLNSMKAQDVHALVFTRLVCQYLRCVVLAAWGCYHSTKPEKIINNLAHRNRISFFGFKKYLRLGR